MEEWMSSLEDLDRISAIQHKLNQMEMAPDDGMSPESFECFSDAPLSFEEMASCLRKDIEEVYELTGTLNRFSLEYPMVCRQLDRMIRRLGSFCVTKAVLEQQGLEFPNLKDLNIKDLYCMVSFNFRKTRVAYHESREKNCADMGLLDLECRWVDLAERLKATEEKIRQIRDGKIDPDLMLERAKMFKGEKGVRKIGTDRVRPVSAKAKSLPVIGSMARQMIAERKKAEKEAEANAKALGLPPDSRGFRTPGLHEARPFRIETFPPMNIEAFEREPVLRSPHEGPSDETRKRLREQRKKKGKN